MMSVYSCARHAPAQDIVVKGYEDVTNTFDVIIIAVKTHQLDAVIFELTITILG
jgi:2-dehydropantoate 2-reductase